MIAQTIIAALAGSFLAMGFREPVKPVEPSVPDHLRAGPLTLSEQGYDLIIDHEVGGGAGYYNRYLKRPTWPGGASGVTIGIGYDLGYKTHSQLRQDFAELSNSHIDRLQSVVGLKGRSAKRRLAGVRGLVVPWDIALEVYQKQTMPRWGRNTARAYDEVETTHPHVQSAVLSWTFNRGSGISSSSSRDREKRAIRHDIPDRIDRLPGHYRSSKRLWVGRGLDGLLRRREDEAKLIESTF